MDLGVAYHRQVAGDHAGALAAIRDAVNADRPTASKRLAELAAIVKARSQGQRCHAHIEKVQSELLAELLKEPPDA